METILEHLKKHREQHLTNLSSWLKIPSISADAQYDEYCEEAAIFLSNHLNKIGFEKIERLQTSAHDVIYTEWLKAPGKPTIMIYGHYDVQPPGDLSEWKTPPFEPTVDANQFIHGRGTSDDKGQVMMVCNALEALFAANKSLPVNVKVFIEGDEESGPAGAEAIEKYAERLGCDAIIICDTGWSSDQSPTIYYGARGLAYYELVVTGPNTDLHSGHYGNLAVNPLNALVDLLAKVRGSDGRFAIPNFYDDVAQATEEEKSLMDSYPVAIEDVKKRIGVDALFKTLPGHTARSMLCVEPSFDLCGIVGGYIGKGAKTIVPSSVKAKLSFRLVPDQNPDKITELLRKFISNNLPAGVKGELTPLNVGAAWSTDINDPFLQCAAKVMSETFDKKALLAREAASIPIVSTIKNNFDVPIILAGMGLPDDGIHTTKEKFSLKQYYAGAEMVARMLLAFANIK